MREWIAATVSTVTSVEMLEAEIIKLEDGIRLEAENNKVVSRRLVTASGVGPITAAARAALSPDSSSFDGGCDFLPGQA
ncbi:hypothetical protein [Falsirhodobacter deserti]|uniref:hypothetical protein n=1 Tax=Falsirhodobacter deserti TaxID=1365611 RepID=UPI000FE34305|nr:hypothetical protein [Falsirhodobacter deserti]